MSKEGSTTPTTPILVPFTQEVGNGAVAVTVTTPDADDLATVEINATSVGFPSMEEFSKKIHAELAPMSTAGPQPAIF
jgi:hypothetical protein